MYVWFCYYAPKILINWSLKQHLVFISFQWEEANLKFTRKTDCYSLETHFVTHTSGVLAKNFNTTINLNLFERIVYIERYCGRGFIFC